MKILVIQTAFLGDVILTLPLVQALQKNYQHAQIDMMVIPAAADITEGSPVVGRTIVFDKKGGQRGIRPLFRLGRQLRSYRYDIVVTPHRSLRTAILSLVSGAPRRIGFRTSALSSAYTDRVPFPADQHEVDRNLSLLTGLGIAPETKEIPVIDPSSEDVRVVDEFVNGEGLSRLPFVTVAPGSVWFTKRWPEQKYADLVRLLSDDGVPTVLIGGKEDEHLARRIMATSGSGLVRSAAGLLSLRQSAELIRRSRVLVTNDSAPMHLGVAMGRPVVSIFGPTVPAFGFGPYGNRDIIVERSGLTCRPCTKHGGSSCPIGTFECMETLLPHDIAAEVRQRIG